MKRYLSNSILNYPNIIGLEFFEDYVFLANQKFELDMIDFTY